MSGRRCRAICTGWNSGWSRPASEGPILIIQSHGGVIVTTPQEASLGVYRKGIAMFQKVNFPILGIVENMSYYTTPTENG